ncbi:hypothetical protein BDW66DRAFT_123356 [Aspergillus desertorum]
MGDWTGQGDDTILNVGPRDCSVVGQYDVNGIQQSERSNHGGRRGVFARPLLLFLFFLFSLLIRAVHKDSRSAGIESKQRKDKGEK